MSNLREAAQAALEALEQSETTVPYEGFGILHRNAKRKHAEAINALRAALAEPEQPDAGPARLARLLADIERYKTMFEVLERHVDRVARMAKWEKELAAEPTGDTPSPDQKVRVDYGPDSKVTVILGNGGSGGGGTNATNSFGGGVGGARLWSFDGGDTPSPVAPVAFMRETGGTPIIYFHMMPGTVPLYAHPPATTGEQE